MAAGMAQSPPKSRPRHSSTARSAVAAAATKSPRRSWTRPAPTEAGTGREGLSAGGREGRDRESLGIVGGGRQGDGVVRVGSRLGELTELGQTPAEERA